MATPTIIPVKCDRNSTTLMGICKTTAARTTELEALYGARGAAYHRSIPVEPRPAYTDASGSFQYKVLCAACGEYQRREAFGRDSRKRNGLQSICRTCDSIRKHKRKKA